MKTTLTALAIALILCTTAPLSAQQRWSFDLRAGAASPTSDLGSTDLGTGVSFDGTVGYEFSRHLSAYAGWDWADFAPADGVEGIDADVQDSGYALGLRFERPLDAESGGGASIWARAAATTSRIEIEDQEGALVGDSGYGIGWEAGAGIAIPFGDAWRATPGVRFRSLSREIDISAAPADVDLRYLVFDVGISRRF